MEPIFQGKPLKKAVLGEGTRDALTGASSPPPKHNLKTNALLQIFPLKYLFMYCPLKGASKMTELQIKQTNKQKNSQSFLKMAGYAVVFSHELFTCHRLLRIGN